MTLHEKAERGSFKGEVLTTELLNERYFRGDTVWHIAAKNGCIKDIPQHLFTEESISKIDSVGQTVLHIAAIYGNLKFIPTSFFTNDALNLKNSFSKTVWHVAAEHGMEDIPQHLFTEEALAQKDDQGNTVWHIAAEENTLNIIPHHLFTGKTLSRRNKNGETVLYLTAGCNTLKDIPIHLITSHLLDMKKIEDASPLFVLYDRQYIKHVLEIPELLNKFIIANPALERAIELRDPRLVLTDIEDNELNFKFDSIKDRIILSNEGAFLKNEKFNDLNDVVRFIEKSYPNIEQNLVLPHNNNFPVEEFLL